MNQTEFKNNKEDVTKVDISNVYDYVRTLEENDERKGVVYWNRLHESPFQIIPFKKCMFFFKRPLFPKAEVFINTECETGKIDASIIYSVYHDVKIILEFGLKFNFAFKYSVNCNGEILKDTVEYKYEREVNTEELKMIFATFFPTLTMAISFMNCKNIEYEDEPQAHLKRQLNNLNKKNPKTIYKILVIDGMKKILQKEGNIHETGIKKAFHICRGHFREYNNEQPLFGKLSGRFWIPQHTRGNKENGIVKKDYKVVA